MEKDKYLMLGETIARSILKCGNDSVAHRIALKGGTYPDKETDLGGLCESALASHIRAVLIDEDVFGEFNEIRQPKKRRA